MLLTTTPTVEGRKILEHKSMVTGETIIGANVLKDFFTGTCDVIGGRSNAYEEVPREAKDASLHKMQERAEALDANVIVGIDIDYEAIGQSGSVLIVAVSRTAVLI